MNTESPKFNITPREIPELDITPKKRPKFEIKEIFPSEIQEMIGKHGFDTLKVDPQFGQNWDLSNLTTEDIYYFGNHFYKQRNEEGLSKQINKFYQTLLRLNPELENIKVDSIERILSVIRGVGSGLHFNDIKYFVEALKGDANNETEENKALEIQAHEEYFKRAGIDIKKDESEFSKQELSLVDDLASKIGFTFSPETLNRIINNDPYPQPPVR